LFAGPGRCEGVERQAKWARLAMKPEQILLQGEDHVESATVDDFKRLLIFLNREMPSNERFEELADANGFIKSLKRRTCLPIEIGGRQASTKYVKKVGNVWATGKDISDTREILQWAEGVELFVGYSQTSIPLETPVYVKHVDDKMQWWSYMSYPNVTTEFPDGDYVIGEAHNFSQEDWVSLTGKKKPLAIFGRRDILGAKTRGNIFYDISRNTKETPSAKPYLCENIEVMTYEDACAMTAIPCQVYVSTKEDKIACERFPILGKMKRIWMINPRRLCTQVLQNGHNVWVEDSDGTETKTMHSVMNTKTFQGNIVCTWESYQRVKVAVLIITQNTRPVDVHRVRSFASEKVIFVEKGGGMPSMVYTPMNNLTLINI
jgi:hypothetical protein